MKSIWTNKHKNLTIKPIKLLVKMKIYLDRSRGYVSLIQSLMIAGMFVKLFGLPNKWLIPFIILFATLAIFVGFLDTKLGVRAEEMRNNSMENPVLKEILKKVRELCDIK
jgi:hypothetical protein